MLKKNVDIVNKHPSNGSALLNRTECSEFISISFWSSRLLFCVFFIITYFFHFYILLLLIDITFSIAFRKMKVSKLHEIKTTINFSTENKEQHQNLKRTEIITYMRGVAPSSRHFALHATVFWHFKKKVMLKKLRIFLIKRLLCFRSRF